MPAPYAMNLVRFFCCLLSWSLLAACSPSGKLQENCKGAEEYRQQAYHFISQKRYSGAIKFLTQMIRRSPNSDDLLLLEDLQEALGDNRKVANSYRQGLAIEASPKTRRSLLYHAATLASMEMAKLQEAAALQQQLTRTRQRHAIWKRPD